MAESEDEFGIEVLQDFGEAPSVDGIILTVVHDDFQGISLDLPPIIVPPLMLELVA